MKKIILSLIVLGFTSAASATLEIQLSSGAAFPGVATSTGAGFFIPDEGDTVWGLSTEVYKSINENIQAGGVLNFINFGDETFYTLGARVRYNLDSNLRDSMWLGGGLSYSNVSGDGDNSRIALNLQFGKRYALSDSLTYTPNVSFDLNLGGDIDEGHIIGVNLISFSGFMNM